MSESDPKAEQRQQVILSVLAGRLTAADGARQLGVSRKTYYEWQARALAGMQEALRDRPGGRPAMPVDPERERLQQEMERLRRDRQMLEGRLRIQEAIRDVFLDPSPVAGSKKKP